MKGLRIYCDEYDFTSLEGAFLSEIKCYCTLALEVIFVSEEEIRDLNDRERNVNSVTDVLSFPTLDGICGKKILKNEHIEDIDENGNLFIGSIAICVKRAQEQAEEYGHGYLRELYYLVTHGVCHLLGYDHIEENDKKIMRLVEERVLKRINVTRD